MKDRWFFRPVSWRVYDGDTILDLVLDLGFTVRVEIKTRLLGIDAPEVRGPEKEKGKISRDWLHQMMQDAHERDTLRIESHDKPGKYGRWLITVWDGELNINDYMVAQGYAEYAKY